MRIPRRGVLAQRKSDGYVWAVYEPLMIIDESTGGTSGSFSLSRTRYKQVAKSYTVSADGTISLTNPTQTTASNMVVGDYLVNISTSNNTSTTGSTLYKITAISGSSTRTITYTAYTPTPIRGENMIEQVESITPDYPIDGLHTDGKWYVMLKGKYVVYVWDVFNVVNNGWNTVGSTPDRNTNPPIGIHYNLNTSASYYDKSQTIYYTSSSKNITIDDNGYASGFSSSLSLIGVSSDWNNDLKKAYYAPTSTNNRHYYYGVNSSSTEGSGTDTKGIVTATTRYDIIEKYAQGSATGEIVESPNASAYPQNGVLGNYWYVYSHEYEKIIDNT